jgi:hypothetical protein
VPKIDWFSDNGDDQPHWEPRPRRERAARDPRDRRARLEQIIAAASLPPSISMSNVPLKRPLHLIWGVPVRGPGGNAEASGG